MSSPLFGPDGRPLPDREHEPLKPRELTPEYRHAVEEIIAQTQARMDAGDFPDVRGINLDALRNEITGIGTTSQDKTMGGLLGGPAWDLYQITSFEAEIRWRASDLGRNIVERTPYEMMRRGYDLEIQPTDDAAESFTDPRAKLDACREDPRRAAAGWRKASRSKRLDYYGRAVAYARARRWDDVAVGALPMEAAPPPPPGPLPKIDDQGIELAEAMEKWAKELKADEEIRKGLNYERAYGGSGVFIGVEEEGNPPLTTPLDPKKVRRVTHLTAFYGGRDGQLVQWRPHIDLVGPDYGKPAMFQLRNRSVPVAKTPAPGEKMVGVQTAPQVIAWIHASRFLIFDGEPTSIEAQNENMGWGDSIFTRVNAPLAQYEQAWGAVAILMAEASIAAMGVPDLHKALAAKNADERQNMLRYAQTIGMMRSVARTHFYDANAKFDRINVSFAGIAELLDKWLTRVAAAISEPVSILAGKLAGGLGATEDPSIRSYYDRTQGKQETRLRPHHERFYKLGFLSKDGPAHGVEPERWGIYYRPLWQLTEQEKAQLRLTTVQADEIEIRSQVLQPEWVAVSRHGGSEFNAGPITIPPEAFIADGGRERETYTEPTEEEKKAAAAAAAAAGAGPGGGGAQAAGPSEGAASVVPAKLDPMPRDRVTGDPTATPSNIGTEQPKKPAE